MTAKVKTNTCTQKSNNSGCNRKKSMSKNEKRIEVGAMGQNSFSGKALFPKCRTTERQKR